MRKYLYAGAVAGCFLLLGAAPAQADVLPVPQGAQQDVLPDGGLGGLLDPANGLDLNQPLDGSPLLGVHPGDNSVLPPQDGEPAARTGFGTAGETHQDRHRDLPLAGNGLPVSGGGLPTGALSQLPVGQLLGGGLPLIGGLLPDGQSPIGGLTRGQEAGLFDGGLPLLGGLGGVQPASYLRTLPAVNGLPAGGTAVDDQPAPGRPAMKPARPQPAAAPPASASGADPASDADPADRAGTRTFSTGRPVAGPDPEFH